MKLATKGWCIVTAVATLSVLLGAIILSIKSAGRLESNSNAHADTDDGEHVMLLAEGEDESRDDASSSLRSTGEASTRQSRSRKGEGRGGTTTSVTTKNAADAVPELAIADVLSVSTRSGQRSRCAESESLARLELNTDRYPWETSWELLDRKQEIISSGPPEGSNYARENRYLGHLCLEKGKRYTLKMYDLQGDGICCGWGDGSFKISVDGSKVVQSDDSNFKVKQYSFRVSATAKPTNAPSERQSPASEPDEFFTCFNDKPCHGSGDPGDGVIRYSRAEVLDIVETVLKSVVNSPGCLDGSDQLSKCGDLPDECSCGLCFGPFCFAQVCEEDCYDLSIKQTVDALITHGVEIRKLCASCDEENLEGGLLGQPAVDADSLGYCTGYAKDATVSGLLVLPIDESTGKMPTKQIPTSIWSHTTIADTCGSSLPSEFGVDKNNPTGANVNALVALIVGASGLASIAPDNVGFGASSDYFKGYIHKTQYQTAAMPLYMKTKRIVAQETNCATELSNDVVLHGYSEGGYGALATAQALESYGADIVRVNAGGGPYMMASAQLTEMFKDIEAGVYPDSRRYYLPLFAAAYSSTYEGQLNYANVGEEDHDAFEESWSVASGTVTSTYTKEQGIATTTGQCGTAPLNALVQKISEQGPQGVGPRTLDMLDQTFVQYVREATNRDPRDYEPCSKVDPFGNLRVIPDEVALICQALLDNDLSDYALTFPTSGPGKLELCHSRGDEVVPFENVNQKGKLSQYLYETTNDHEGAGLNCIRRSVEYFNTDDFKAVRDAASSALPSGAYCAS